MTHACNLSYTETLKLDYAQVRKRLIGRLVPCDRTPQHEPEMIEEEEEGARPSSEPIVQAYFPPMTEDRFVQYLEIAESSGTKVRRYHVMRVGCAYYGCTKRDLLSKIHKKLHVQRRYVLAHLMQDLCGSSLPAIARTMGGMDHTTILHHIRNFKKLETDPLANERIETIKAEIYAIRRQSIVYAYTQSQRGIEWGGSFSLE